MFSPLADSHLGNIGMLTQQKKYAWFSRIWQKGQQGFCCHLLPFVLKFKILWIAATCYLIVVKWLVMKTLCVIIWHELVLYRAFWGITKQKHIFRKLLYLKSHWCERGSGNSGTPIFWISLWHLFQISVGRKQIKLSMWHVLFLAHSFAQLPETSV